MVLSILDFIGNLPSLNIIGYSVQKIRSGEIREHYDELQRDMVQVGPKIAAFYLRDVVSLYQLEDLVPEESAFCIQPIDVWVRKLVKKMGMVGDRASDDDIRKAIIALCRECSAPRNLDSMLTELSLSKRGVQLWPGIASLHLSSKLKSFSR